MEITHDNIEKLDPHDIESAYKKGEINLGSLAVDLLSKVLTKLVTHAVDSRGRLKLRVLKLEEQLNTIQSEINQLKNKPQ